MFNTPIPYSPAINIKIYMVVFPDIHRFYQEKIGFNKNKCQKYIPGLPAKDWEGEHCLHFSREGEITLVQHCYHHRRHHHHFRHLHALWANYKCNHQVIWRWLRRLFYWSLGKPILKKIKCLESFLHFPQKFLHFPLRIVVQQPIQNIKNMHWKLLDWMWSPTLPFENFPKIRQIL